MLFIDAVRQIARERAQGFLTPEHQKRILRAYDAFDTEPEFAAVSSNEDVLANDGNLSILRYVTADRGRGHPVRSFTESNTVEVLVRDILCGGVTYHTAV